MMTMQKYGWIRDLPDQRDHLYSVPARIHLPTQVDLRTQNSPVTDQGNIGSCTAHALCSAVEFDQMKQRMPGAPLPRSHLFLYYNERDMEHTITSDSGATLRDGIKSLAKLGVCSESAWPYDLAQVFTRPPIACYHEATAHRITSYQRIGRDLYPMQVCLASGFPFIFGFTVYASMESDACVSTGKVPMPSAHEVVLGGHAVIAVGYDNVEQWVIFKNSWGTAWGDDGYGYLPYDYMTSHGLTADFWMIRSTS
jgi:C1A family cysteine protease